MTKPFETVWSQGKYARQAHRDLPEGTYEREIGQDGFSGPATHMYHRCPPTSWESVDGPLRPRAFNLKQSKLAEHPYDVRPLLTSRSIRVGFWKVQTPKTDRLVRNADGDELLFIHAGSGELYCDYGHLSIEAGDYVVIPRGTMWRIESHGLMEILTIGLIDQHIRMPERGLLGKHALYDPAVLDIPQIDEAFQSQSDQPTEVVVKRQDFLSTIQYRYNPLDAVGWKGDLSVLRLHVRDVLPVNSHRVHLPPSVHATFETDQALISTFVPRPFETDPTALKVPFFHNNDDIDEVLFYHSGNFFSRDGIDAGCLTLHPSGITHGPHPKSLERMFVQDETRTNEVAVMIDSKEPFTIDLGEDLADGIEIEDYANSWRVVV